MQAASPSVEINSPGPINTVSINSRREVSARAPNGRARADYNAYMRGYMRRRREINAQVKGRG